ncbi:TIGR04255 family protein [Gordonia sp. JH63]|uniref:TIGR04255 family protein n=1 Tax=Gordonia TaxID=2053 RepID=UPI00131F5E47|nr:MULTISPECIES: TIGR04255 family protein [Gordonia]MCZ0915278.1 TIGR04255 family protein [Gordonia amicalis]QHD87771.1 TIGR04255 family protein [Gordonia sp. JH63]
MDDTPLYSNAPIAVVLLEIRHPASELSSPAVALLKKELAEHVPIERTETNFELNIETGERRATTLRKLVARDLHAAVTFRTDAVVVEATDYRGWAWFRRLAEDALRARHEVAPLDGIERIGLRYIDEVRVPGQVPVDWSEWVSPELLGPREQVAALGLFLEQQQSVVQYGTDSPGHTFTLRYGVGKGSVIQSTDSLKRLTEPPLGGEFFLMDTDGAWSDASGRIPEFDVSQIINICDKIHAPIKQLFESLITDRLRKEVLNNED